MVESIVQGSLLEALSLKHGCFNVFWCKTKERKCRTEIKFILNIKKNWQLKRLLILIIIITFYTIALTLWLPQYIVMSSKRG